MKIADVKLIARVLMNKHGLGPLRWKLIIINSKSMAGYCQTSRFHEDPERSSGTIALSADYMEVFDEAEVRETILHEIAHALTDNKYKSHGPEWRKIALSIGSNGKRCVDHDAPKIASRYVGKCEQGHSYPRHKKTDSMLRGGHYCPPCRKKLGTTVDKREYITWFDTYTNQVVSSPKKVSPREQEIVLKAAQKAPRPTTKATPTKATSWKDRFDQGMTNFGDDW